TLRLLARSELKEGLPQAATGHLRAAHQLARELELNDLKKESGLDLARALASQDEGEALDSLIQAAPSAPARQAYLLEKALALHARNELAARDLLESFLIKNPRHPRRAEAALALAENCLYLAPPDPALARSHLDALSPENGSPEQLRVLLARLALNEGENAARHFLRDQASHPQAALVLFKLAEMLQRRQETGEAHLAYETLLDQYPDSPLAPPARLLSARTALALGTASSLERALQRFDELAASPSPLATSARLEKIRALLDHQLPDEALAHAREILAATDQPSSLVRWQALALAAEACSRPEHYESARKYYEELLADPELPLSWRNRVSFLLGRTLEQLALQPLALDIYYGVINRENQAPEEGTEWHWYYRCAFDGAIPLLEKARSWRAAHAIATRLAEEDGPQAERARQLAKKLSLEHLLWED
ncbi:MAG: tetratricopeptide repeat protein, partial [Verrucomicrobiales bacterium]